MKRILLSTVAIVGLTSAASAADLYTPAPVIEEPGVVYAAPTFNWTGFYAGVQAGYGWANADVDLQMDDGFGGTVDDSFEVDADGWLAGVNIGADYQIGSWVLGAVAEYNWSGIEGDETATVFDGETFEDTVDAHLERGDSWSVLARAGYLVTPQALAYVLGGYTQTDFEADYAGNAGTFGGSDTLDGWTVGVGGEVMLTQNISAKAEARYTWYDESGFDFNDEAGSGEVSVDEASVLVGLNFRFPVQ